MPKPLLGSRRQIVTPLEAGVPFGALASCRLCRTRRCR